MENYRNNAIIFFDGYCKLCNFSVSTILKFEQHPYFKFSPITSEFTKTFFKENYQTIESINSVILYDDEILYYKSDALIKIAEQFRSPYKYLNLIRYVPKNIRDSIYDFIAKYRFSIVGKRKTCRIPTVSLKHRFL